MDTGAERDEMCGVLCQEVANFVKTRKEMKSGVDMPTIKTNDCSLQLPQYLISIERYRGQQLPSISYGHDESSITRETLAEN